MNLTRDEILRALHAIQRDVDIIQRQAAAVWRRDAESGQADAYLLTAYDCISAARHTLAEAASPMSADEVAEVTR